ncbi:hypothetical protein ACS5PN_10805 [Roseateles sp. NT4]|uniref:hypothetical protein n=1 Tax=Roseateles sp. NT4 TaxID=3453715 RepID=UPI003EEA3BB8
MEFALLLLAIAVAGLMASLHRVERRLSQLQADQARLMHQAGLLHGTDPSGEVRELARDPKRRIDAIRLYRQQSGLDLREAKAVVDAIAAKD